LHISDQAAFEALVSVAREHVWWLHQQASLPMPLIGKTYSKLPVAHKRQRNTNNVVKEEN